MLLLVLLRLLLVLLLVLLLLVVVEVLVAKLLLRLQLRLHGLRQLRKGVRGRRGQVFGRVGALIDGAGVVMVVVVVGVVIGMVVERVAEQLPRHVVDAIGVHGQGQLFGQERIRRCHPLDVLLVTHRLVLSCPSSDGCGWSRGDVTMGEDDEQNGWGGAGDIITVLLVLVPVLAARCCCCGDVTT
jgi:hypothetical protein